MNEFIEVLLRNKEVTVNYGQKTASLHHRYNYSKYKSFPLSIRTAYYLIEKNILEFDTGNWESEENHYIYNDFCDLSIIEISMVDELVEISREVKLNNLIG